MDEIVKKAIQNSLIRKPSKGFSDEVMEQIYLLKTAKPYQPLISKTGWVILCSILVMLISVLLFFRPEVADVASTWNFYGHLSKTVESVDLPRFSVFSSLNLLLIAAISMVIFLLLFFDNYLIKKR
ncbi:MAG: hypothetical protein ACERKD_19595 [Prolixibacteraceae bacterium]